MANLKVDITLDQTAAEVRSILWRIANDPEQSGTARVSACRLLLIDARERNRGPHADADLNRRAIALLRQVSN